MPLLVTAAIRKSLAMEGLLLIQRPQVILMKLPESLGDGPADQLNHMRKMLIVFL
jgi:hypothetical protein